MSKNSLKVIDNRTDETYDLPITYGTYSEDGAHVRSADLNQIKGSDNDFGLLGYDPSYVNTASCSSAVTYIDGAKGILRYRGYPIEQLVAESSYLEVAYLLVYGELPSRDQLDGVFRAGKFSNGDLRRYFVFYRWFSQRVSYDGYAGGCAGGAVGFLRR